jgi:hypothetical protein
MNIVKTNHFSKMHNLYDNSAPTSKTYFKHRIDDNIPNFAFKRVDSTPDEIRTKYDNKKCNFSLKKEGFLGKMYVRHLLRFATNGQATVTKGLVGERLGEWIIKKARIMQQEKEIEEINPLTIRHRIDTSANNEELNNVEAITPVEVVDDAGIDALLFYTPLFFSSGSDINSMLDLKFIQTLKLELDIEEYEDNGLSLIKSHEIDLLSHYMTLDDYETYAKTHYKKPLYLPLENSSLEGGDYKYIPAGENNIRLRNRDLVKMYLVRVEDLLDFKRDGVQNVVALSIKSNNEVIYKADNALESLLFNHNYRGLVSHRVSENKTDGGTYSIPFDISNYRNGFSGGLNMDEIYKDCKLNFIIPGFDPEHRLIISYLYYDMLKINTDGTIEKAEVNNTPFLDEYDYSTEPTKPELPKKEAPPAKVSL